MNEALTLAVETALLVAAVGVALLLLLVFRNPLRPRILQSEATAIMVSILLVLMFGAAFIAQVYSLTRSDIDPLLALAISVALLVGCGIAGWKLFGVTERLRRADAGESPF